MRPRLQFRAARTLIRAYLALFDLRVARLGFPAFEPGKPAPIVVCHCRSPLDPMLLGMVVPGEVGFAGPFETPGRLPHQRLAGLFPVVFPPLPGERLPAELTIIVAWDGDPNSLSRAFLFAEAAGAPILPVAIGGSCEAFGPGAWVPRHGPLRVVAGEPFPAPAPGQRIHSGLSLSEASQALQERLGFLADRLAATPPTMHPLEEPAEPAPEAISGAVTGVVDEVPPSRATSPFTAVSRSSEDLLQILVTGSKGQLGTELQRLAPARRIGITAVDLPDLDIGDGPAVRALIRPGRFDAVINAAAFTAVDKAETEVEAAFRANRDGPANLADACIDAGIPLFHISTDYVFDGTGTTPWREFDPVNPQSVYGRSKAEGELAVRARIARHLILRTSWVYSPYGANFVKTILRLARERETLRIVADQHGCPTAAHDLADALLQLAERAHRGEELPWGTWHFCGTGATTWHGFTEEIVRLARAREPLKVQVIEPITTDQYPLPAKRPANSVLDCTRTRERLGISAPPWQESLAQVIENLYKSSAG